MYLYNPYSRSYLAHYGVKGMKWGVRRYRDKNGNLTQKGLRRYGVENTRVLKKGTEIQNISRTRLDPSSKKSNRIYGSYTDADKASYLDLMGNFQYNRNGYKNTFVVKSDIKIASEKEAVKTLAEMFRDDPERVSNMMASAYNAVKVPIIFKSTGKGFKRKLSELEKDPESKKSLELGRKFIQTVPMTKSSSDLANDFYGRLVKKGFDAVLDTNDAYAKGGGAQDPLIIFNMEKLGHTRSVKLTEDDLDRASNYVYGKEHNRQRKDYSSVAHSAFSSKRGGPMPKFTQEKREELAKQGLAMPDGGYPIRNRSDLLNAIKAYGRGTNKPEVKRWIKKRAKDLRAEHLLPDNWETDGELAHYGIKGMKWGVRRYQNKDGSYTSAGLKRRRQTSSDYEETKELRKKSYKELSDSELKRLNKRLNLESEYRRLNPQGIERGKKIARDIVATAGLIGGLYAIGNSPYARAGRDAINIFRTRNRRLGKGN